MHSILWLLAQGSRLLLKHKTIQTVYVKTDECLKCQKSPTCQTLEPVIIAVYCINILEVILIITISNFRFVLLWVKDILCLRVFTWLLKLDPWGLMHELLNTRLSKCPLLTSLKLAPSIAWIISTLLFYSCTLTMVFKGRSTAKITVIIFMVWDITASFWGDCIYSSHILL